MSTSINKIGVFTSGGDSPGMNAAIRAVVRACAYMEIDCMGIYRGYEGMIDGDFIPLNARSVNNIINKGGTFLKSARCPEFRTPEGRQKAFDRQHGFPMWIHGSVQRASRTSRALPRSFDRTWGAL